MLSILGFSSLLKRVQIFANSYYNYSQTIVIQLRSLFTMSSSSLVMKCNDSLLNQINDVYTAVDAKLSGNECPQLVLNCRNLHLGSVRVIEFAKHYDFNAETEANGYWTYIKLVLKFGQVLLSTYQRGHDPKDTFLPVSQVLITGLQLCEQFHHENTSSEDQIPPDSIKKYNLFAPSTSGFINLLNVFKSLAPQLDVVYGNYCSYWLCPSMRRAMQGFTTLMAIYASSSSSIVDLWQSSKNLWDRAYRAHTVAHIAQNATVEFVKGFWGLTELSFLKTTLPAMIRIQPKVVKDVYVPRQHEWKVSSTSSQVHRTAHPESNTEPKVRCRLLQNQTDDLVSIDSVVLHIHGGGFVSQSPDSHEVYLRDWASKLKGVPLLSVDYSHSPEAKYPVALQEILDVYLWLISNDVTVKETLGFCPSHVVVCGDSAGGNLSVALCLVLNDIRKSKDADAEYLLNFRLPAAAICFYTPFMLQTIPSPSRLLTAVDTLLPLGVLLSCLEAYAGDHSDATLDKNDSSQENRIKVPQSKLSPLSPSGGVSEGESDHDANQLFEYASLHFMKPLDYDCEKLSSEEEAVQDDIELENDFVHITYDDVPPDEDLLFEVPNDLSFKFQRKFCHTFRRIRDSISGSSSAPYSLPWYRKDLPMLSVKLEQINAATSNPYISPCLRSEFDFEDVTLYLVALTYDACLDDSIEMAKKWKGPVVLDILEDLPHGFLNFVLLSEEGKRGSELCISRIKQALGFVE